VLDFKLGHGEKDASGNLKPGDIGLFLKEQIPKYCKSLKMECNLKYIDPSYMIRSLPASASDKQLCAQFAQNAVHGVMAGFTGFTSAVVNLRSCYIPFEEITKEKRFIKSNDRKWQRLLASTGQPSFINAEEEFCEVTEHLQETLSPINEPEMIHRTIKRRNTEVDMQNIGKEQEPKPSPEEPKKD
jgi:6-phosphofructokinase 1